jgi:hypothetical protein
MRALLLMMHLHLRAVGQHLRSMTTVVVVVVVPQLLLLLCTRALLLMLLHLCLRVVRRHLSLRVPHIFPRYQRQMEQSLVCNQYQLLHSGHSQGHLQHKQQQKQQ